MIGLCGYTIVCLVAVSVVILVVVGCFGLACCSGFVGRLVCESVGWWIAWYCLVCYFIRHGACMVL